MYAEPIETPRFPGLLPPLAVKSPGTAFSLHVGSTNPVSGVFSDGCQIFAAAARLNGVGRVPRFARLCTVPTLGPEGVYLMDVYVEHFGAAREGWTVCVRVVPISTDGFRGPPVFLSCVVGV